MSRTYVTFPHAETGARVRLPKKWQGNEAAERVHERLCASRGHIFTSVEHVSKSGMTRYLKVFTSTGDYRRPLAWCSVPVAEVLGWPCPPDREGVKVDGAGMDMGFHLAYSLAHVLYGDGYAIRHDWI